MKEGNRSRKNLLPASVFLALITYVAGSTGPIIVHGVHLLHHVIVLQVYVHLDEGNHQRTHTHLHGTDRAEKHTHGDLIDHAVIWSNAGADEERSAHTVQESRFSLHIPLIPFSSRTSFTDLSSATLRNDRLDGRLRPEPPTPPPRVSLPQQSSI
jgi:hypothetical protein